MMQISPETRLSLALERRTDEARVAAYARLAVDRRGLSFRLAVARALVRAGERLAADTQLQPAGPR